MDYSLMVAVDEVCFQKLLG